MKPLYRDQRRRPGSWVSATEVQARANISYRQLDYWCSTGYLVPDRSNPGSGRGRSFSADEAEVACLMGDLVRLGVTPLTAARLAREIAHSGVVPLGDRLTLVAETAEGAA